MERQTATNQGCRMWSLNHILEFCTYKIVLVYLIGGSDHNLYMARGLDMVKGFQSGWGKVKEHSLYLLKACKKSFFDPKTRLIFESNGFSEL